MLSVVEVRPPNKKGLPVVVKFSVYVIDINSINVEDMDFRVDLFIRSQWKESRLKLPNDIFEEGGEYSYMQLFSVFTRFLYSEFVFFFFKLK